MDSDKSTSSESTPTKQNEQMMQKMQHGMMALIRVNPSKQTYEILSYEEEKKHFTLLENNASIENCNQQNHSIQKQIINASKEDTECDQIWEIQEELNNLDSFFSAHVTALKKQIETASQEFTLAQKKYKALEKEYVNSKIDFLQKLEQKEQLQENLHTIIQQYEAHRAVKLHELEQRLNKFILKRDGKLKKEKSNSFEERKDLSKEKKTCETLDDKNTNQMQLDNGNISDKNKIELN